MERIIVRQILYPALLAPPPTLVFSDQYAFRPTGSTTATLVSLLHFVTSLLSTNQYVIVIALDFSKAFDTVLWNLGRPSKNPAYRIFQTEYSGCLDISAHA